MVVERVVVVIAVVNCWVVFRNSLECPSVCHSWRLTLPRRLLFSVSGEKYQPQEKNGPTKIYPTN